MMHHKGLYLAGPMSGLPQFNHPLFHHAAAELRAAGFTIISPAELDSPEMQKASLKSADGKLGSDGKLAGETWADVLARDVKVIADQVEGIIFLPNWWESRGARLEAFVALLSNKTVFGYYIDGAIGDLVRWIEPEVVRKIIQENMP